MHPLSGDTSTIDLTEGGSLGVAAFGDPDGIPCFAFHGTASSRLMPGWMFPTELLTAAGVRMIGVDRAGYGLSTMPKVQRFSDWPSVVEALADHLGIGRLAVLAHSLGSAFALACGTALGDRLTVIVILSGMGPLLPNQRFRARSRADNLYWWLARHQASWLLNSMCGLSASMMLRSARGDSQRFLSGLAKQLPEEDRLSTQRVLARAGHTADPHRRSA